MLGRLTHDVKKPRAGTRDFFFRKSHFDFGRSYLKSHGYSFLISEPNVRAFSPKAKHGAETSSFLLLKKPHGPSDVSNTRCVTVYYETECQVRNGGSLMPENSRAKPHGAGKSSYDLVDHEKVIRAMRLRKGGTFLDMGCGSGDYTHPGPVPYSRQVALSPQFKPAKKEGSPNLRQLYVFIL